VTTRDARDETDESLAVERAKADAALHEKTAAEHRADIVIDRARDAADEVLSAARASADESVDRPSSAAPTHAEIVQDRASEDELIEGERAKADEMLRKERAATARMLARLIPLEREKTDKFLLTERARSDEALANRDDFLGMVSHDLRDLLHGIVLSASFIADNIHVSSETASSLASAQRIQRAAGRMSRLISDLVDIASIDAGKLSIRPVEADASEVVREALEIWQPPAANRKITLEASALVPLRAAFDHERVLQILGNLITNALKFSEPGGKVVLGLEHAGSEALFSVRDTGAGIPKDKLELIFERFWQVGKHDRRGIGLGLYISRCLVEAHGGRIWAESGLGTGSTFFFTIPARPSS
jgi:signal transduction histidine kinase